MKTKKLRIMLVITLIVIMAMTNLRVNAINYQVFYMDNINNYDTIVYQAGGDSLRLIAPQNITNVCWLNNNYQEIVCANSIVLPSTLDGNIAFQSLDLPDDGIINVVIMPFRFECIEKWTLDCGESINLGNYISSPIDPDMTLTWFPAEGLSDTTIYNPVARPLKTTSYILTAKTQYGLIAKDTLRIEVRPLSLVAGKDKTLFCGGSVQLDEVRSTFSLDGATYFWSPAAGLNSATSPYPVANKAGTYAVTVTYVSGCQATDVIKVQEGAMDAPVISIVSVNENNKNIISWCAPELSSIDSFYIYKETNVTDIYEKAGAVAFSNGFTFVDTASQPDVQSNKYMISIKDNCGYESKHSTPHKTMHLSINKGQEDTWNLIWESYEGIPVSTYNIYRGKTPDNLELIGTTSSSSTQYSDLSAPSGYLYYQVEIIVPDICTSLKKSGRLKAASSLSSRTNIVSNKDVLSGVEEINNIESAYIIFPVPSQSQISIIKKSRIEPFTIAEISNIEGRLIKKVDLLEDKTIINIENLAKGIYFIKICNNKEISTYKFIKK